MHLLTLRKHRPLTPISSFPRTHRCGTCQEFAPIFAGAAEKLKGKFTFGTVSIDDDGAWRCVCPLQFPSPLAPVASLYAPLTQTLPFAPAAGMELAQQLDILSEGIPNVRAFVSKGSSENVRVFSGWEVRLHPGSLPERAARKALRPVASRASCGNLLINHT